MKTFFHGWRRKIGSFALALACVFMGQWLRSCGVCDQLKIQTHPGTNHWFISSGENLCWVRSQEQPGGWTFSKSSEWRTISLNGSRSADSYSPDFDGVQTSWDVNVGVFRAGTGIFCGSIRTSIWQMPLWTCVWPPSLLAAYLLIFIPGKQQYRSEQQADPA
jgi:hypothetical protein